MLKWLVLVFEANVLYNLESSVAVGGCSRRCMLFTATLKPFGKDEVIFEDSSLDITRFYL